MLVPLQGLPQAIPYCANKIKPSYNPPNVIKMTKGNKEKKERKKRKETREKTREKGQEKGREKGREKERK